MFAQCSNNQHEKCRKVLVSRYYIVCDCPCHRGRPIPANPCSRCHGTGRHGPLSVQSGICFQCGGSGEQPAKLNRTITPVKADQIASDDHD